VNNTTDSLTEAPAAIRLFCKALKEQGLIERG
jgi:hypothetical protein